MFFLICLYLIRDPGRLFFLKICFFRTFPFHIGSWLCRKCLSIDHFFLLRSRSIRCHIVIGQNPNLELFCQYLPWFQSLLKLQILKDFLQQKFIFLIANLNLLIGEYLIRIFDLECHIQFHLFFPLPNIHLLHLRMSSVHLHSHLMVLRQLKDFSIGENQLFHSNRPVSHLGKSFQNCPVFFFFLRQRTNLAIDHCLRRLMGSSIAAGKFQYNSLPSSERIRLLSFLLIRLQLSKLELIIDLKTQLLFLRQCSAVIFRVISQLICVPVVRCL